MEVQISRSCDENCNREFLINLNLILNLKECNLRNILVAYQTPDLN